MSFFLFFTQEKFQYLGFAFVNDTNNCASSDTLADAIQQMQELINAWDAGAHMTGGKLVEKSHWYLRMYPTLMVDILTSNPTPSNTNFFLWLRTVPESQSNCCHLTRQNAHWVFITRLRGFSRIRKKSFGETARHGLKRSGLVAFQDHLCGKVFRPPF